MKIQFTFKDPDTVYDAITDAAKDAVDQIPGLSEEEKENLVELRRDKLKEACSTWIEWGEYARIEIDTDAGTATVCKVK